MTSCLAAPERGARRGPSRSAILRPSGGLLFHRLPRSLLRRLLARLRGGLLRLQRDALAALDRVIVGPEQVRRHAPPWPPGFGDLRQRLGVGALAQIEGDAHRLLYGKVAGREGVGMA